MDKLLIEQYQKQMTRNLDKLAFFFEEILSEVNWSDDKKGQEKSLNSTLQGEHRRWTKH